MKKFPSYIFALAILMVGFVFLGMKAKPHRGKVVIDFTNYVGKEFLALDTTHYKNELGQDFTVTNFKYYIGKIRFNLMSDDVPKTSVTHPNYFLIKADDPSTWKITLDNMPSGNFISMSFTLGVDSASNCRGAQSGALDPVNAMFWSWNQGYIFLKLEGKSPFSLSTGNTFEYHIGGYQSPNNCIRTVTIDLMKNNLIVAEEKTSTINLKADAAEVLKTPTTIDFSKLSSVVDFHNATMIANNYQDMFSLLKVENAK